MITLYQFATSPFTEKVRRALNYKAIPFEVHEVDRARVAGGEYADVSVSGKFPAIRHGDTVVLDSTDILAYLDSAFPERPLIPADARERAQAHIVEDWADESLYFYEMTLRLSWEHNLDAALDEFAEGFPAVPRDQLRQMILDAVGALTRAQGLGRKPVEKVIADVDRHFEALDTLLDAGPWLVGSSLSSADISVIGQVNSLLYAKEGRAALARTRHVADWLARVDALAPA